MYGSAWLLLLFLQNLLGNVFQGLLGGVLVLMVNNHVSNILLNHTPLVEGSVLVLQELRVVDRYVRLVLHGQEYGTHVMERGLRLDISGLQ